MSVVNRCARCEKSVYPTEELKCLDKVWHKLCFKCQECGMTLNMKSYKGYNKLPYCNAHTPVAKHTTVADTPEGRRLAENTKLQSQAKYHEEFERNIKGKATQLADDPELQRLKQTSKIISNVEYHREIEKKQDMENRRRLVETGIPLGDCEGQIDEDNNGGVLDQLNDVLSGMNLSNSRILNSKEIMASNDPIQMSKNKSPYGKQDDPIQSLNQDRTSYQQYRNEIPRNGIDSNSGGRPYGGNTQAFPVSTSIPSQPAYQQQQPIMHQGMRQNSQLLYGSQQQQQPQLKLQMPQSNHHPRMSQQPQYYNREAPQQQKLQQHPQQYRPQQNPVQYPGQALSPQGGQMKNQMQMQRGYYPQQQMMAPHQQMNQISQQPQQMIPQYYQQQNGMHNPAQSTQQMYMPQQQMTTPMLQELRGQFHAIYDYKAQDHDEVSFLDGDLIIDCFKIDEGWILGKVNRTGQRGMIPANYVVPA